MWTRNIKDFGGKFASLLVRGLVRWLELLGENPPLSRDHGLYAWQRLHEIRRQGASGRQAPSLYRHLRRDMTGPDAKGRRRPALPGEIAKWPKVRTSAHSMFA